MFSMTLICMGKLKEKFYIQASEEYKKRLGAFCDFTLLELPEVRLPENPNETQILQGLSKEAELIRAKVPKGSGADLSGVSNLRRNKISQIALADTEQSVFARFLFGFSAQFILSKRPFSVKINLPVVKNRSARAGWTEFSGKGC